MPHRIVGESATGDATFENFDPAVNTVLCDVSSGGAAEIDRTARAAEDAFKVWRTVLGEKRRALLGDYWFDFYMEQKNIAIGLDKHRAPKIEVKLAFISARVPGAMQRGALRR